MRERNVLVSAFTFGTLLEHPASPVHQIISNPLLRRVLMGIAMGLTAIGIIYSPWGRKQRCAPDSLPSVIQTLNGAETRS